MNEQSPETTTDANATPTEQASATANESAAAVAAPSTHESAQPAAAAATSEHAEHASGEGAAAPAAADAGDAPDAPDAPVMTAGEGGPAAGGVAAPTKKRRRRRRKSAAERAAARAAAIAAGASPDVADAAGAEEGDEAEGAEGGERAEGAEGTVGEAGAAGEKPADGGVSATAKGPNGQQARGRKGEPGGDRGKNNRDARGPKKDRPRRDGDKPGEKRDARERPAFNYGDVVFGKVTEITDEAIFVDLAGKGRGIFDRREMSIPDEPAQGPDAVSVEEDDDLPPPRASSTDAAASAEAAPAAEATAEATAPAAEVAAPATDDAAAPTSARAPREKRIIVARTILQGDAPQENAAAGEEAAATEATGGSAEGDAPAKDEAAPEAASADGDATEAASEHADPATPAARPTPAAAPVLPPVVLELGSVFVGVVHNDGSRGGLVVLTRHPRRASKAKPQVSTAFREKTTIEGLVTGVIKGGVEVDVDGLRAFAPRSHMDLRPGADLHHTVGQRLTFDVTQYAKKGRDVVLSRKAALESEAHGKRADALAKLPIGQVVEGTVRTVVTFGAFIDVGGVEGLVPLSEMSHNRADGPKDVFKVGEKVQVKILRVDEKGKIWLSRRSAVADPWGEVASKYAEGTRHTGKIVRVQPFGAFVELENGIDGLIHTSDLSIKRIEHPNDVVKVGDSIDVIVSHVDSSNHKIALHPVPTGVSADEAPQKVQIHKQVKVSVVAAEVGGLTVRILGTTGRHSRGFIPAGATGTPRGTELRKIFPLGKELEAKVIEMDPKRSEIKLSIKALAEDTERSSYNQYRAQVKKEAKFGTFGDLLAKSLKKEGD